MEVEDVAEVVAADLAAAVVEGTMGTAMVGMIAMVVAGAAIAGDSVCEPLSVCILDRPISMCRAVL